MSKVNKKTPNKKTGKKDTDKQKDVDQKVVDNASNQEENKGSQVESIETTPTNQTQVSNQQAQKQQSVEVEKIQVKQQIKETSQLKQQVNIQKQPNSQIKIPQTFTKQENQKTQQQEKNQVQVIQSKTQQETQLPKHIDGPQFKISQEVQPETEADKQSRQQAQRLTQFRRKHMIFPPKQSTQPINNKPLGSKVLAQTFSAMKQKIHPHHQQIIQTDFDESRLISATTTSRRRQNQKLFRQWNQNRSKRIQCYVFTVQNLLKGADGKVKQSFQNLQIFITFFKSRAIQQQKYSSHPVIDAGYSMNQNQIAPATLGGCSEIMQSISQFHIQRCKKIQNFVFLIKQNILTDILEQHTTRAKQQLNTLKEKILAVRAAANEIQHAITQKTVQLGTFVQQRPPQPQPRDYYYSQNSFLKSAAQLIVILKKYGQLAYNYYSLATDLQKQRAQKIKKAINIYISGMSETYGFVPTKEIAAKLSENDPQAIQSIYNVSQLLEAKLQQFIKQQIKVQITQPLTLQELKNYFTNFAIEPYNCRMLILKQFKTVNVHKDSPNETCHIVISVDRFLHVYLNTQSAQPYAKPTRTFKIDRNLKLSRQGSVVQVAKTVESKGVMSYIIWQPPIVFQYTIQFSKDDAALQFQDCVRKLY